MTLPPPSTDLTTISKRYEAGQHHRLPHFDPLCERLQRTGMKRYGLENRRLYLTNDTENYVASHISVMAEIDEKAATAQQ